MKCTTVTCYINLSPYIGKSRWFWSVNVLRTLTLSCVVPSLTGDCTVFLHHQAVNELRSQWTDIFITIVLVFVDHSLF